MENLLETKMDDNVNIEVLVAEAEEPKKSKRGGRRPGSGRPALVRLNKERMEQGLEPIEYKKGLNKKAAPKKRKSTAILPASKKARHQEILAEMMTRKGKYIVHRIIEKAMDDDDKDQMECLKIVVDRILPKDYMMKANNKSNSIQIHISGVGQEVSIDSEEVMDADYEEVYEEDNE
jgi:hypothetical protein